MFLRRTTVLGCAFALATALGAGSAQAVSGADTPPAEVPVASTAVQAEPAQPATTTQVEAAKETQSAPTKPRAKRKKVARPFADVTTGPSRWKGNKLRHPSGRRFPGAVKRWANLVAAVMYEKKIPKRFLRGILAQIQQESSGNRYAVNRWDINAARGTPSKGLLQIIAPTYRAHAKPGFRNTRYQTVPYTNIWASLEYVLQRYGMKKFKYWNRGYNQGY